MRWAASSITFSSTGRCATALYQGFALGNRVWAVLQQLVDNLAKRFVKQLLVRDDFMHQPDPICLGCGKTFGGKQVAARVTLAMAASTNGQPPE